MKKFLVGGGGALVIAFIGLMATQGWLPPTQNALAQAQEEQSERLNEYVDEHEKEDAKRDLAVYYMQRGEKRREIRDADPEDLPDIEEEMAQIQDDIEIAKDKLKEKD